MTPVRSRPAPRRTPLVLIPGWGSTRSVWSRFLPALTRQGCLFVDLPGHGGKAPDPAPDTTLEDFAAAAAAAAPPGAVWVGWSLGGLVALAAAGAGSDGPRALVVVATSPCFTQRRGWPLGVPQATFEQFSAHLHSAPQRVLRRFHALATLGARNARRHLPALAATRPDSPPLPALAQGLRWLAATDFRERLATLDLPVAWVFGDHDPLVPQGVASYVAHARPDWSVTTVAGGAHIPFAIDPDAVMRAVEGHR